VGSRIFSTSSRLARGPTQPLIEWVSGAISPGVKKQGSEADRSPPSCTEVKKKWIYTSTPPKALRGVVLNWLSAGTNLPLLNYVLLSVFVFLV
jgi:hypothetical protein